MTINNIDNLIEAVQYEEDNLQLRYSREVNAAVQDNGVSPEFPAQEIKLLKLMERILQEWRRIEVKTENMRK